MTDTIELDQLPEDQKWVLQRLAFLARTGSKAYGTATPTSDTDYRGFCVPPLRYLFGTDRFDGFHRAVPDLAVWPLARFCQMLASGNHSANELLWTDPSDHVVVSDVGARLLAEREKFLSRRLLAGLLGAAESATKAVDKQPATEDSARAAYFRDFGYDVKSACHSLRLSLMARDLLRDGKLVVRRPDAASLSAVRQGLLSRAEWGDVAEATVGEVLALEQRCQLPDQVDPDWVSKLCLELTQSSFNFDVTVPIMMPGFGSMEVSYKFGSLAEKVLSGAAATA